MFTWRRLSEWWVLALWLVLAVVALMLLPRVVAAGPDAKMPLEVLAPEEAWRKAQVNGKYSMLLRQFKAPQDAGQYGDFRDLGARQIANYAGRTDLPKGHWVYVHPFWYIWRDVAGTPRVKRPWGPEQATGPPDTPQAGDVQTAWASRTPDDQDEWLLLEYAAPIVPEAVLVYETFNPGALYRVTVFGLDGEEVEVWKGKDPTARTSVMGTSEVKFRAPFKTNRVRIYLDSKNVPGWNEIDAVGLRDTAGKVHWAVKAEASSTFAQEEGGAIQVAPQPKIQVRPAPGAAPVPIAPLPVQPNPKPPAPQPAPPGAAPSKLEERVKQLEKEVRDLKAEVEELNRKVRRNRR